MHVRLDTNKVFYIGKGTINSKGISERSKNKKQRNVHWKNITNVTDWRFDILRVFDDEMEALIYETRCIDMFGIENEGGQLCNILKNSCDGGISFGKLGSFKVYKYSLEGDYIETYESIRHVANELGCSKFSIQLACSGKIHTSHGFQWRLEKFDKLEPVIINCRENCLKPVYQYTMGGEFIKEHKGSKYALLEINVGKEALSSALNKRNKSAGGYKWSYELIEN